MLLKFMVERPSKSIFPCDLKFFKNLFLFVLDKCPHQPLTKLAAKTIMRNKPARKEWLKGVVEAIRELHALKIAHFDIRLPNICFKEDGMPVLIDLDRSVVENNFTMRRDFDTLRTKYNNSEMYSMNVADDGIFRHVRTTSNQSNVMTPYI